MDIQNFRISQGGFQAREIKPTQLNPQVRKGAEDGQIPQGERLESLPSLRKSKIDSRAQSTEVKALVHQDSELLLLIHVLPIIPSSAGSFLPGLFLTPCLGVLVLS